MNMENIMAACNMMGQGMIGIFVVLGLIAVVVRIMSWSDNHKKK